MTILLAFSLYEMTHVHCNTPVINW